MTIPATRIAVSDACERSAQASSSTSMASTRAPGQPAAASIAVAARVRSSAVGKKARQAMASRPCAGSSVMAVGA